MELTETVWVIESLASAAVATLGQQAVYATVLFLVVAIARFFLRNPRLRYGLWSLVLLRLVLPTGLASSWSARTIVERATPSRDFTPVVSETLLGRVRDSSHDEVRLPWGTATILLWALGATSCGVLIVKKRRYCRGLVGQSHTVKDEFYLALAERWRTYFAIRRTVALVTADEPLSPFTVGAFRPVIFLPSSFLRRSTPASIEAAIAHEMAHIRRWDDLKLLCTNLVQSIYFFHPVAWMTARRMGEERERICDDMVLARGALSPRDYGRGLLEVLRLGWESRFPAASFGNHKRRIFMRIQRIVKGSAAKDGGRMTSFLALVFLGSFLLPMARSSQSAVVGHEAQPSLGAKMANPLPGGRVTSSFGERKNPFDQKIEHHTGIDIAAPAGSKIQAPMDGVVEIAKKEYPSRPELGTVIVIDHGQGTKTFYAHLGGMVVESGRRVARGDTIATVGSTGLSRGAHLHFEVWRDGRPVDPALLLGDLLHLTHRQE